MILRWFISPTVRQAGALRNHVERLLAAQRDLLSPQALGAITLALNQLRDVVAAGENIGKIRIKMDELDFAANKWLKPYPHAVWRENVEVVLVVVAVAMAIRTFFVQPFKIPTGSMQPTLFGVTSKNYLPHDGQPGDPNSKSRPAGNASRNGLKGFPTFMLWRNTEDELDAIEPDDAFSDFQHQADPLDRRPAANDLVSAGLRRTKPGSSRRPADSRGFGAGTYLSQGRGRGENPKLPRATICLWTG